MGLWCIPLYADDVRLIHQDLFTLLKFVNVVVERIMIMLTVGLLVFCAAVFSKQAK